MKNFIKIAIYFFKMLPKLKKKIASFLMDEKGAISKKNLIKGAIILGSLGLAVKEVKPYIVHSGGIVGQVSDSEPNARGVVVNVGSGNKVKWNCKKKEQDGIRTTTCVPAGYTCKKRHSSSGQVIHKSVDRRQHGNALNFEHRPASDIMEGTHAHHGRHYNANTIGCTNTKHSSHCSY
jgi:hypothetical protein